MSMTLKALTLAATMTLGLSATAHAAGAPTAPRPPAAAPSAPQDAASSEATVYCIREASIGSRIERDFCRTREEWLEKGTDPLKRN
ncbi:hypothetical protein [Sphingomonas sp.]|uniref:hypothetical protein n=1 Tax=Sphingomonas sp. TaxID=28214 RepID=UPI001EB9738B|nr:hypothetical protein [Sphingomonas sp.]MBX3594327.1 hypothetical protein [Sphingomonas sp.]